jgi:hypothetical protein
VTTPTVAKGATMSDASEQRYYCGKHNVLFPAIGSCPACRYEAEVERLRAVIREAADDCYPENIDYIVAGLRAALHEGGNDEPAV